MDVPDEATVEGGVEGDAPVAAPHAVVEGQPHRLGDHPGVLGEVVLHLAVGPGGRRFNSKHFDFSESRLHVLLSENWSQQHVPRTNF